MANYRPITNLNTIGTVLERLVQRQRHGHVEGSPNIGSHQSAYYAFHSTETVMACVTSDIVSWTNSGMPSVLRSLDISAMPSVLPSLDISAMPSVLPSLDISAVPSVLPSLDISAVPSVLLSLDISAAFDTLDHTKLIERARSLFGLSDTVLDWIRSYLSHRQQHVSIHVAHFPSVKPTKGMPQGSVLSPLLFSIFTSPKTGWWSHHDFQSHLSSIGWWYSALHRHWPVCYEYI